MAISMMNVDGDYKDIVIKMLSVMLAADLNVSMEVTEVPKMVLGALSGLNQTVESLGLTNDDARYNLIAQKILQIVSKANVRMGAVMPDELIADFAPVNEELRGFFLQEKLSKLEVKYILDSIFTNFGNMNNLFNRQIDIAIERMQSKALGIEAITDLNLKTLDGFLQKAVEEAVK